jgi:plastocyanin
MKRHVPLLAFSLLFLVACSTPDAGASAPEASAVESPSADLDAEIALMDFMLDPEDVEVAGPTVTIAVTNDGPTPHNLSIRTAAGETLLATDDLSRGEQTTLSGELEPGDYVIFCSLGGHESLGMSGTLTVTD